MSLTVRDVLRGAWARKTPVRAKPAAALPAPAKASLGTPLDQVPAAQKTLALVVRDGVALTRFTKQLSTHRAGAIDASAIKRFDRKLFRGEGADSVAAMAAVSYVAGAICGASAAPLTGIAAVGGVIFAGSALLGTGALAAKVALVIGSASLRGRYKKRAQPEANIAEVRRRFEETELAVSGDPLAAALWHRLERRALETLSRTGAGVAKDTELWSQEVVLKRPNVSDAVMRQAERLEVVVLALAARMYAGADNRRAQHFIEDLSDEEKVALQQVLAPLLEPNDRSAAAATLAVAAHDVQNGPKTPQIAIA